MTTPELFDIDDLLCSSTVCSSSADEDKFDNLDECLDAFTLAQYIRSQHNANKRQQVSYTDKDLRPMAFVRLNTSLGKPTPVTIRALLDIPRGTLSFSANSKGHFLFKTSHCWLVAEHILACLPAGLLRPFPTVSY